MPRLPLSKILSFSLVMLNVAYINPSFGGKLADQSEDASSLGERKVIANRKIQKLKARLERENHPKKLKTWEERLEDIEPALAINMSHIPHEIWLNIFRYLSPKSLSRIASVCKDWTRVSNDETLWRSFLSQLGLKVSNNNDPKLMVISALKISTVNSIIAGAYIRIVRDLIQRSVINSDAAEINRLALWGYKEAIGVKIEGLATGKYGYEENPAAAKDLNEKLTAEGNPKAIERKIKGFATGKYGYEKNPGAAKDLNEKLVAEGNSEAIERKVVGLFYGEYGYEEDPVVAKDLNEKLVAEGNPEAIEIKIKGLAAGKYGYEENRGAAKALNEKLVAEGNPKAIERKVIGLFYGQYGYEENPEAAKDLNEKLVAEGNPKAIEIKIEGLATGSYDYEENPEAAKDLNEKLVAEGNPEAIERKIKGLFYGWYGYAENPNFLTKYIQLLNNN